MSKRIVVHMPVANLWPGIETAEVGHKVTLYGKPDAATVVRMQVDSTRRYFVLTLDVDDNTGLSSALLDALACAPPTLLDPR